MLCNILAVTAGSKALPELLRAFAHDLGVRVEELEAEIAELTTRLVGERDAWSRPRVTRETVAELLAELSGQDVTETATGQEPETQVEREVQVVGAIMVPHLREGRCRANLNTRMASERLSQPG